MTKRHSSQVPQAPPAVREVDENMRAVLDCAAFWVVVLDRNGQVGFWNQTAEVESGYRDHEILGDRRLWELLYPDPGVRAAVMARSRAVIDQGDAIEDFETPIRTRSGETKVISWSSQRVIGVEGENLGLIAIGRDVTERQADRERHLAHAERLARLHHISLELLAMSSSHQVYRTTAARLGPLSGGGVVTFLDRIDPVDHSFRIRAVSGPKTELTYLTQVAGRELTMLVGPLQSSRADLLKSGRLARLEGGLADLLDGVLPAETLRTMASFFGKGSTHTVGLVHENDILGSITMTTLNPHRELDRELIEKTAGLVSVALARLRRECRESV